MNPDVAILLPSYRRRKDLENVLKKTPISRGKFIVVANYPEEDFKELSGKYSDKAIFIDEIKYGKLGVAGAYNLAFKDAREKGFPYVILFADDVLPFKNGWLDDSVQALDKEDASMGVFSSDEGHFGTFGWNIINDAPIAHFFIARTNDYKIFFDSRYRQYVIDFEIAVRTLKQGKKIILLPIRLKHFRSPINRDSYGDNYTKDLSIFLKDYPEYTDYIKNSKEVYMPEGPKITLEKGYKLSRTNVFRYPPHKNQGRFSALMEKIKG